MRKIDLAEHPRVDLLQAEMPIHTPAIPARQTAIPMAPRLTRRSPDKRLPSDMGRYSLPPLEKAAARSLQSAIAVTGQYPANNYTPLVANVG